MCGVGVSTDVCETCLCVFLRSTSQQRERSALEDCCVSRSHYNHYSLGMFTFSRSVRCNVTLLERSQRSLCRSCLCVCVCCLVVDTDDLSAALLPPVDKQLGFPFLLYRHGRPVQHCREEGGGRHGFSSGSSTRVCFLSTSGPRRRDYFYN